MAAGSKKHVLIMFYGVAIALLFLYSYTQVDLNLTLSRASVVQSIQKSFQYVGFYNRPLSAGLYIAIIGGLFGLYAWILSLAQRGVVTTRQIWKIIWICTIGLVFSYPAALSYDFFNYLFTAKTVLVYHKNPYTVTPLEFASIDPWVNFMRWTHLSSAYTPLWIGISLIPFILGLGYFLPVLLATKLMIASFFLLACFALSRILSKTNPKDGALGLAVFALNPLVLIETLVSGHNDIVMVAFLLLAIWFAYEKQVLSAWVYLALSVAAKLMTIVLIPVFFLKKNITWMLACMTAALLVVVIRRDIILPWYWVWIVPLIALIPRRQALVSISTFFSLGLLLSYVPYLYVGSYSDVVVRVASMIPYIFLGAGVLWAVCSHGLQGRSAKSR